MPRSNEAFLMSGWLFADLLLALAVLFLAANTATIKPLPPTLIVNPTILDITNHTQNCTVETAIDTSIAQCTVTLAESNLSKGDVNWSVSSDISNTIRYTVDNQAVTSGRLSPGQRKTLTISAIPCQNGSFTFNAAQVGDNKISAAPLVVQIKCTPRRERLDFNYQTFQLTINDVNAFLNSNSQDNDIRRQITNNPIIQGKSVGLTAVYDGAQNDGQIQQAQQVAQKIYTIMSNLGKAGFHSFDRSSYYRSNASDSLSRRPLYNLGDAPEQVQVDVYFFTVQ